jgi:hypothetical protein
MPLTQPLPIDSRVENQCYRFSTKCKVQVLLSLLQYKLNLNQAAYLLEESDSLKFNCFEYSKVTEGEELSMLMLYLFEENDLIDSLRIKISTFMAFVK